jgi:hypothetical protein
VNLCEAAPKRRKFKAIVVLPSLRGLLRTALGFVAGGRLRFGGCPARFQ